jgi:hypothetical protein
VLSCPSESPELSYDPDPNGRFHGLNLNNGWDTLELLSITPHRSAGVLLKIEIEQSGMTYTMTLVDTNLEEITNP